MRFLATLILAGLVLGLSFWNFFPKNKTGPAALQVFSKPAGAPVVINGETAGVTPYKNEKLTNGEIKLIVGTGSAKFASVVKLTSGVVTIVNRELAQNPLAQSGEILNLEPGAGLVILSQPETAEVEVDDQKVGTTPVKLSNIIPAAHKIMVSAGNYVTRSIQIQTHKDYRLTLNVTLASTPENLAKNSNVQQTLITPKVRIGATSTGFLRVRDNPSLAGTEIARVNPGEELDLLEEKPDWFKIRLKDGKEGWISSQYAQKL